MGRWMKEAGRLTWWGVLLLAAMVAGCDRGGPGSVGVGEEGSAGEEEPLDDVVPDVSEVAPRLVLLEPGGEPRRLLRYRTTRGHQEQMRLQLAMEVEARTAEQIGGGAFPPTTVDFFIGPVDVFDGREGDRIRYRIKSSNVSLDVPEGTDPELLTRAEAAIRPLGGIDGSVVVNERGITDTTSFAVPDDLPPRARVLLGNIRAYLMSIPFPEQAVGVGARWKMVRGQRLGPFQVQHEISYTLRALEGTQGRVEIAIRTTAPNQELGPVEPEVTAYLESYEGAGNGSARFDLRRLVPFAEADMTTQLRARLEHATQGESGAMQQRTRIVVALGALQ